MSLDARSARLNTELGMVIDSPELEAMLRKLGTEEVIGTAYHLRLAPDAETTERDETGTDGTTNFYTSDPGDSFWMRLKRSLLSPFVDDEAL